jgi:hypothetical protein
LRDRKTALDELGAAVLVISFEDPDVLRQFHWFRTLPFTVVSDLSRRLYQAFGLQTRSVLRLIDRTTVRAYASALLRGRLPRFRNADVGQLGGDFVLNRAGEVVFSHRSATPADRPPVEILLGALRNAGH